jgi:hypothetical protein
MKATVYPANNLSLEDLCPIELLGLKDLSDSLSNLNASGPDQTPTKMINSWYREYCLNSALIQDFRIDSQIPTGFPYANYRMDAVSDHFAEICGHDHRLQIQKCFDNRQAIGTNLLKFQIGDSKFGVTPDKKTLSVLICAGEKLIKSLGWDSSVGSFEEYDVATRYAYHQVLDCRIIFLVLR